MRSFKSVSGREKLAKELKVQGMSKCPKTTNYDGLQHLRSGKWDCQRATKDEIRPISFIMEEGFPWKTIWFRSCQITHMIALTTQSHRLTSFCGILDSLQSPQSDVMEDGQEDRAKRFFFQRPKLWSEGTMKKIWTAVSEFFPQSKHDDVIWIPLLARLSAVKRRSWKSVTCASWLLVELV